jgi:DNA end-binding protein Ku
MAKPLWSGSLSFGLVNVPVALFSATRDRDIHFQLLHAPDCSPIETRRVCAAEEQPVPWPEIARGYELENGEWVLLSDEDLQAAAPRQSRTIDIERFVEVGEIDPVYFDRSYLLVPPDEGAARAYALLSETMGASGKAALGRFVLRAKERLVCIRVRDGALTLTTMLFGDEVRARRGDRGAQRRVRPDALPRRAPRPPQADHQTQAAGEEDRRAGTHREGTRHHDGPRSDGRARAEPRADPGAGEDEETPHRFPFPFREQEDAHSSELSSSCGNRLASAAAAPWRPGAAPGR